jgi:hypothetical protein
LPAAAAPKSGWETRLAGVLAGLEIVGVILLQLTFIATVVIGGLVWAIIKGCNITRPDSAQARAADRR